MVADFLNCMLSPFYAMFNGLDIEHNFAQAAIAVLVIITIIDVASRFIIKKY